MIAKPGDLVFFKDKAGRTAHIGIVYKVDGRIYTYEGNSSSVAVVTPNGGAVVEKVYAANYDRIVGYARPKYEEDDIVTPDQFRAMYKTMIAETHGDEHSAWADEVIKKAVSSGLFQGNNGNFEWKDPLSREEFAAVLDRLGLLG
jgi:hypothetical protein